MANQVLKSFSAMRSVFRAASEYKQQAPKALGALTVTPSLIRGVDDVRFPPCKGLEGYLANWPGAWWRSNLRCWACPKEFRTKLAELAPKFRLTYRLAGETVGCGTATTPTSRPSSQATPAQGGTDSTLPVPFSFQEEAADRIVRERSLILAFEMGLGKTRTAIMGMQRTGISTCLIVCPAIARQVWLDELAKWWPGHPAVSVMWPGGKNFNPDAPFIIVSYETLSKVVALKRTWGCIVSDELHYIAHGGSSGAKRALHLIDLGKQNHGAVRIGLTGTPVMTEPKQLHNQLEFLWPSRFGNWFKFTNQYCNVEGTGFVTASGREASRVFGLNEANAAELEMRLLDCMSRKTKAEVAHLLPPFTCQTLRIDKPRAFDPKEIVDRFMRPDKHKISLDEFVKQHSNHKIGTVADMAVESAKGTQRVAVLTYLHMTAHLIAEEIKNLGGQAQVFTGETAARARVAALKKLSQDSAQQHTIAVISMSSVRESIDLTAYTTVYFAEMYPSPGLMEQVTGRFHRLSSKMPVNIYFVIINGSYEETVAAKLTKRLRDSAQVYKASLTSEQTIEAFTDRRSEEEFSSHLMALLNGAPNMEEE